MTIKYILQQYDNYMDVSKLVVYNNKHLQMCFLSELQPCELHKLQLQVIMKLKLMAN